MRAEGRLRHTALTFALALGALLVGAVAAPSAFADWSFPAAGQLNPPDSTVDNLTAASVGGTPYVAAVQSVEEGPEQLIVERWSAGAWTAVGDPVGSGVEAVAPGLVGVGGVPYVAIPERGAIHVYEFNGSAWAPVGDPVGSEAASEPSLAEVGGKPCVGFEQGSSEETEAYVYCWSGTTWEARGNALTAPGGGKFAGYPSLVDDGGKPLVAWDEGPFFGLEQEVKLYAALWSGSSWSQYGPLNLEAGSSVQTPFYAEETRPALIVDGSTPYLAFAEENASQTAINAYVESFNGTAWSPAGEALGTLTSGDSAQMPALGVFEGEPLAVSLDGLASGEHELAAKTFDGSVWSELGGPLGAPGLSAEEAILMPAVAVDGSGTPWVFFLQESEPNGEGEFNLNLYAENYTVDGIDPIGGGEERLRISIEPPTESAETTTHTAAETGASSSSQSAPAASAVLELLGSPSLTGHTRLKLKSGIAAYCPPGAGTCAGTITLTTGASASRARGSARRPAAALAKTTHLKGSFTVAAGHQTTASLTLSKSLSRLVRATGHLRGSVTVTATGSNHGMTQLSQSVAINLAKRS